MVILITAVVIVAILFLIAHANIVRQNKRRIPKESLRSLIIEGVIKVRVEQAGWNNYGIRVVAPMPLRHSRNENNYLVLSYIDGSSPTVIKDDTLGDVCLT